MYDLCDDDDTGCVSEEMYYQNVIINQPTNMTGSNQRVIMEYVSRVERHWHFFTG